MPPRNYRNSPRRSRLPRLLIGGIGILMLMSVGIVSTLWLAGVPLNPFAKVAKEDPYMVRIPVNAQPIPAYTRVERTQMINPATGGLMFQKVPPASVIGMSIVGVDQNGSHAEGRIENVKRLNDEVVFVLADNREVRQSQAFELGGAMLNVNSIIGRVVKRDKRAGLGFQESTFFPQGTPEGIAGATPAGMRAITLDATKLTGVHALGAGDQIDLLASFPVDASSADSTSLLLPGQAPAGGKKGEASEPYLLAQKAIVLKPVYIRNEASTSASLTQGTRVQNVPKYEVAIAVKPDDLIPLQRALNQSLPITCITHSMKPGGETPPAATIEDADTIMVPVTVHPVLAYNVVTREAFVSQATRTLKLESMSRSQVAKLDIITALDEALGAVAKHDIPAGRFLRRSDLLNGPPGQIAPPEKISTQKMPNGAAKEFHPDHKFVSTVQQQATEAAPSATAVGDRPAITRFVPPGRTAFAIPWNRVYGSEHLQIGDEIDLMASYSLESTDKKEETETRADGTVIVRKSDSLAVRETERTWANSFGFRAEPWFVATDAIVIAPVGFPPPASALRALGEQWNKPSSTDSKNGFSGPPVIIAVDDRDVEAVTAALATRDALFSVGFHANDSVGRALASGSKQIVVISEPLAPYQEFNESIWQGNRRRITSRIVSSDDARFDDAITVDDVRLYFGRVMGRAKSRGDTLTADDFMPPGTKPGLAAGVPAGHTFFPVADRDIQGLDSFNAEDHVAILIRGVVKPIAGVQNVGIDYTRPVSTVVVANARIARATLGGQTVLAVANQDLAPLQAAIARSQTDRQENERSHLIAVLRPRPNAAANEQTATDEIPAFDPLSKVRYTETIIGSKRSIKAFVGSPTR